MRKRCSQCFRTRKLTFFYHDKRRGPYSSCKDCCAAYRQGLSERTRKAAYDYRYRLARTYGITPAQVLEKLLEQKNRCAICSAEKKLHVDHDHQTGRFRGMLCGSCNKAIGLLKESPQSLQAAMRYLEPLHV